MTTDSSNNFLRNPNLWCWCGVVYKKEKKILLKRYTGC
ncbi:unnamed protein product [Callosobruchus maculatus]|uniref:Uncharacterized protein n=1 Tax=Callosobruchus maculatus TaxID=64391 RepID=A0A653CXB3_CALMS|nr:unnamed protein product [Callosobruchus maculatus]